MLGPLNGMLGPLGRALKKPFIFLLRDDFTTTASAPLASPRTCEPGPGTFTLVQVDGQLSTSSAKLVVPAQSTPTWSDEGIYTSGNAFTRAAGVMCVSLIRWSVKGGEGSIFSFGNVTVPGNIFAALNGAYQFQTSIMQLWPTGSASVTVSFTAATSTDYYFAIILRASGCLWLVKGGIFTQWTLLYVTHVGTQSGIDAYLFNYNDAFTADLFRVADLNANGQSTWGDDYGIATVRYAGTVTVGQTFTHEADFKQEFTTTVLPGLGGDVIVKFRKQDANNCWQLHHDGNGAVKLIENVAGSWTTRVSVGGTTGRVWLSAAGSTIRIHAPSLTSVAHTGATNFQTQTVGEYASAGNAPGTITNLVIWPHTLSAALSADLDMVVGT